MIRTIILIIAVILVGALLWWFFTQDANIDTIDLPAEGTLTIQGEIVCLPHRDSDGPQTLECAYGLEGDDMNFYALRDQEAPLSTSTITSFPTGTLVTVVGEFTIEEDDRYATVGALEIRSITRQDGAQDQMENTHSDGTVTFTVPEDFGLAVTDEQILVDSVIPPCESGFEYCLYYNGDEYADTNFLSAGVRIDTRTDLTDLNSCLTTQPTGYADLEIATSTASTSSFAPLQNAAAGSYSIGEEYRLFASSTCYQFTTRVGASQFGNTATGTVEFTQAEQESLLDRLRVIIEGMTLFDGEAGVELPDRES